MKTFLQIKLTIEKTEKQLIQDQYKKYGINMAGRVLNFIREDIVRLNDEKKK